MSDDTLYLIDGSGFIFRAFFKLPQMSKSDGTPIGAVYGFTRALMNLVKNNAATHMAVVFDASRKTFRQDIYPEYKATRRETPEALIPQFPLIREAVRAFNIKAVEMEGYEADDLIATYAALGTAKGMKVKILSADKDMMQLVGDGVELYDAFDFSLVDNAKVMKKFGVTPDKVIEVQALAGDSSDNVPGVKGIGPKGAAELVNSFGSVEEIYEHISDIKKPRIQSLLKEYEIQARISKQLVTLCRKVPVEVSIDDFKIVHSNYDKIMAFLKANEFKSLMSSLPNWQNIREDTVKRVIDGHVSYVTVDTLEELRKWIDLAFEKGIVAFDTETDNLDAFSANLIGFSLSVNEGEACYVPLGHTVPDNSLFSEEVSVSPLKQIPLADALTVLKPLLSDRSVLKIGHNIKYDMNVLLKYYGNDFFITPLDDTMVMSYALDGAGHRHGMDELSERYLNHTTIKYSDVTGSGKNKISFAAVPVAKATAYAAEDADITLRLYNFLKKRLFTEKMNTLYEVYDRPLINVLSSMERNGVLVDAVKLKNLSRVFEKKMNVLETEIKSLTGEDFNLNSPSQLGEILFDKMKLDGGVKSSKTGKYSTDVDVLEDLAENGVVVAEKVLEYRGFAKIKSTYTDVLPTFINKNTGRIHTGYLQTGTSTGRLASSDPNLQNIPVRTEDGRKIRQAFICRDGYKILSADYSQIELRIIAEVADITALKRAFIDNIDIHALTASKVFGVPMSEMTPQIRRSAKAINFGIIYGISSFGLSKQLGISRTEAGDLIKSYYAQFPELKVYMDTTVEEAKKNGYVKTVFGRKCFIAGINDKNSRIRNYAMRAAVNAPIQGTASDLMRLMMIDMYDCFANEMIMQVHDELVFEIKSDEVEAKAKQIKAIMENVCRFSVPLVAEVNIGDNWDEAH